MKKKGLFIIEVLVVIGLSCYYVIHDVIPEYKEKLGSSDKFINTEIYQNMIEVNIDNSARFILVIDEKKRIYHIMFMSLRARSLYNQNIEGKSFISGVKLVNELLVKDNVLSKQSSIVLTGYGDEYFDELIGYFKNSLVNLGITTTVVEKKSTIKDLALSLKMDDDKEEKEILRELDYHSRELSSSFSSSSGDDKVLSTTNGRSFTNNVYKRIEEYVSKENIQFLDKNSDKYLISLISADYDKKNRYFPTSKSWYYVSDGKVYADIELALGDVRVEYCYLGSIDEWKKGEC